MSSHQTFLWGRSQNKLRQEERWLEFCCIVGLLLASLLLFGINLGSLPLRDWDEGTVAQVAKEIWQAPEGSWRWLFPTLWGEPYLNKPPLVHAAIALFYSLGGVDELTSRLPGALLSAVSVVLLYGIGREIFVARIPALFSAIVYLTFLPVVRHGRLAMLDGPLLCFALLMFWAILRSRRDLRWTLVAGFGLGLIGLTKGIMGLLLGAIALLFLSWDTPRLLTSIYLWVGILLGSVPVIGWYAIQWLHYRQAFISTGIVNQSLARIWSVVEENEGPPWYYLLELLKYAWPWLIFAFSGLQLAWSNRRWGWAKLILVWSSIYFVAVSLMATKLPWYILPLYPALALATGAQLDHIRNLPSNIAYPRLWTAILGLLAILATVAGLYFSLQIKGNFSLLLIFGSFALTLAVGTILIARQDRQFIPLLFWGTYVSLLVLVSSPYWLWELNEAYPVKPIAALIEKNVPVGQLVYTSFAYTRPSLNFYSEHQVIPATVEQLKDYWQKSSSAYILIDRATVEKLDLESARMIGVARTEPLGWFLVTKTKER
jgi:4-amino-4-deoxy-L-arabinose transferase-like glycosyltransferase